VHRGVPPLSRLKRWTLGTVLRRAVEVAVDHPALATAADTRVKKTIKKKKNSSRARLRLAARAKEKRHDWNANNAGGCR